MDSYGINFYCKKIQYIVKLSRNWFDLGNETKDIIHITFTLEVKLWIKTTRFLPKLKVG